MLRKRLPIFLAPRVLLLFTYFSFLVNVSRAATLNRTIDDQAGDSQTGEVPLFLPSTGGVWATQTCIGCAILPDTKQTFDATYTAATYNPGLKNTSISMNFQGTAIYVFFVLANNAGSGITTFTTCNFTLDGKSAGTFTHQPDMSTSDIQYNSLVFSLKNLVNSNHQLVISTTGINVNVYVNFDYAIYTHVDAVLSTSSTTTLPTATDQTLTGTSSSPFFTTISSSTPGNSSNSSTSSSSSPVGAIIGGVVGGLAFAGLAAFVLMLCNRRKQNKRVAAGYTPPLMLEMGGDDHPLPSNPLSNANSTRSFEPQHTNPSSATLLGRDMVHNMHSSYTTYSRGQLSVINPDGGNSSIPDMPSNSYGGYQNRASLKQSEASGRKGVSMYAGSTGLASSTLSWAGFTNAQDSSSDSLEPQTQEEVRRARQNEIDERLRVAQQEMNNLSSDIKSRKSIKLQPTQNSGVGSDEQEAEFENMREQMRQMREQIMYLQEQQRSPWAQGLSDEPPPGYTN